MQKEHWLMPDKNTHLVLVYGSLRAGLGNHHYLHTAEFKKYLKLDGFEMYDNSGYYPYVFYTGNNDDSILGEVYEVDNMTMRDLDRLEGISENNDDMGHYKRRLLGKTGIWIYLATDKNTTLPKVPHISDMLSGDESDKYNFADWKTYLDYRDQIVEDEYGYSSTSYNSYRPSSYTRSQSNTTSYTPKKVDKNKIEFKDLGYDELESKYQSRVNRYAKLSLDELRDELKQLSKKFELSTNERLLKHYYNLIQLTGWVIKKRVQNDEQDAETDALYKFLDNRHLQELSDINFALYSKIKNSVSKGEFEKFYAGLFKEYDSAEGKEKDDLAKYLDLIDKALSADSSLRGIEKEVQRLLGESAGMYMDNVKSETHGVLSALLEEVRGTN